MRCSLLAALTVIATFVIAFLPAWFASAATIHVPADQPTIQAGIEAAVTGDTVLVACDTYHEHDIGMKADVTLRSETGAPECATIDAGGLGRGIVCENIGDAARIEGFTITGGLAGRYDTDAGGGIGCIWGASPLIQDCVFSGNAAAEFGFGGGVGCARSSNPILRRCVFMGNSASSGGGFAAHSSAPRLEECTLADNQGVAQGGGVYLYDSPVVLDGCTIGGNTCTTHGGGLAVVGGSSATLTDCLFTYNTAGE